MLRESKELPKQNQHFIPRSFLNEFTSNSEGWFHELNIATKYLRKIHINNVCKIENFYDINDEAFLKRYKIDNPRYLEHSFTYENSLRKILTKIRNKEHYLDRTEFQTMVEAYVSLKHRTFYFRKQFGNNELTGQIIDSVVETFKVENQDLIKSHKFNYDEFVEKFKYKTLNDKERPKTHHLFGLLESSKNQNNPVMDAIVKILSMNIIIIESPEQDYFLVSDNPG